MIEQCDDEFFYGFLFFAGIILLVTIASVIGFMVVFT